MYRAIFAEATDLGVICFSNMRHRERRHFGIKAPIEVLGPTIAQIGAMACDRGVSGGNSNTRAINGIFLAVVMIRKVLI